MQHKNSSRPAADSSANGPHQDERFGGRQRTRQFQIAERRAEETERQALIYLWQAQCRALIAAGGEPDVEVREFAHLASTLGSTATPWT